MKNSYEHSEHTIKLDTPAHIGFVEDEQKRAFHTSHGFTWRSLAERNACHVKPWLLKNSKLKLRSKVVLHWNLLKLYYSHKTYKSSIKVF